jgi:Tfp pilus assembly protein PilX/cytoskeletal protein CcmA (bactofilin family)
MLTKFRDDERGVAMVVALTISFVVMLLSIFVVRLALHDVGQSSYDRRRLLSVNAAEAGVKDYYAYMTQLLRGGEQNELSTIHCTLSAGVSTGPNEATYDATIQFYGVAGSAMACPPPSGAVPSAVRISSTGQAPSGASRTMESYAQLIPVYGGTTAAVLSQGTTTMNNKLTINGFDGNDADFYVNGNLNVTNQQTFKGNVYVQGSVSVSNSSLFDGMLWARDSVTISQGNVNGDTLSTTGSISISNPAVIYGNAKARTTIASTSQIAGQSYPNTTDLTNPPAQAMPPLPYDLTKWTNAGFALAGGAAFTSCTAAKSWLTNPANLPSSPVVGVSYNYVVRIQPSAACTLSFGSGDTVYLPGNVAILTDCGISTSGHPIFQSVGGNHALYLVAVSGTTCSTGKAITISNLAEFKNTVAPNRLDVFIYSPGTVSLGNQTAMNGQVYGTPVLATNQTTLNYIPVFVPGLTTVTGFRQNIQYLREVPT